MNTIAKSTKEQMQLRKMEATRSVFQKVVRIMSGKMVRVNLEAGPPFPGWTDGQDIFLNETIILNTFADPNFTDSEFFELITKLWGITYHELSHIIYSPRQGDMIPMKAADMARSSLDISWWYAYNGLEDQRIETWFTALYRPTQRFFQAAVLEWLMGTTEAVGKAHVLTHGRRYLPLEIRQRAKAAFEIQHGFSLAIEAEKVIDEYVNLVFPKDDIAGWKCVERYQHIIRQVMPQSTGLLPQPSEDNDPRGQMGMPQKGAHMIRKGRSSVRQQEAALEEMNDTDFDAEPEMDDAEDVDAGDELTPQGAIQSQSSQSGKKSEWDLSGHSVSTDDDADDEDSDHGSDASDSDNEQGDGDDSPPSNEAGTGEADPGEPDQKSAMDELMRSVQEHLDTTMDSIADDIDNIIDDIYDAMRSDDGLGGHMRTSSLDASLEPETSLTSRRCVDAVNRLRMDLEPQKVLRQSSGRANMKRMLTSQDHELDLFDQWDMTGDEVGGIEVVINVDLSGSMNGIMGLVSRILWSLKHAFDVVDIRCTVLGFTSGWSVLYRPGERAEIGSYRLFGASGGTQPKDCLNEAVRILSESESPNRAMVTVTDGSWATDDDSIRAMMDNLHRNGGESLLVGLNDAFSSHGLHRHSSGRDIASIEQLPAAVMVLVESMLKRAASLNIMH